MSPRGRLGEIERAVMEELWGLPDDAWLTVREVHGRLSARRDLAYTTVMTVLDRMARKDLVLRERDGRAYRYRPAASRGAMTAEAMRGALDEDTAAEDRHAALVAFVGEASEQDRAALRDALARLERGAEEGRGPA